MMLLLPRCDMLVPLRIIHQILILHDWNQKNMFAYVDLQIWRHIQCPNDYIAIPQTGHSPL